MSLIVAIKITKQVTRRFGFSSFCFLPVLETINAKQLLLAFAMKLLAEYFAAQRIHLAIVGIHCFIAPCCAVGS